MDPRTGVVPGLKVMVDRATRWKFSWQQSPLAACPQEVKDGVKDGTKVGGTRSAARSRRRQNWHNPGLRRVGQVGVVEWSAHRSLPLARVSALSRQDRRQLFKHPLTNSVALNGVLVPHESTACFLLRKRKTVFEFQRSL